MEDCDTFLVIIWWEKRNKFGIRITSIFQTASLVHGHWVKLFSVDTKQDRSKHNHSISNWTSSNIHFTKVAYVLTVWGNHHRHSEKTQILTVDLNPGPSCCEVRVLNIEPLCHPIYQGENINTNCAQDKRNNLFSSLSFQSKIITVISNTVSPCLPSRV